MVHKSNDTPRNTGTVLLSDNILTPVIPDPNLVQLSRRDIDSRAQAKGLFLDVPVMQLGVVVGVCDGEAAAADEMGCYACVGVGGIMGVAG
jgi:hypothetical protein